MKKKKLYLTAFLLVLALALQGGIFSGFSVPVQAAATSKKQTGFVKKNGTTEVAGNCLAILTQNAYGKTFVSIVMGAATKELLYQEMNSLLQNINS